MNTIIFKIALRYHGRPSHPTLPTNIFSYHTFIAICPIQTGNLVCKPLYLYAWLALTYRSAAGYKISVPPNGSALFPLNIAETSYEARFEIDGFVGDTRSYYYDTAIFHVEALNGSASPVTWSGTPIQSVPVPPVTTASIAVAFATTLSAIVISTVGQASNPPLSTGIPSTSAPVSSSATLSTSGSEVVTIIVSPPSLSSSQPSSSPGVSNIGELAGIIIGVLVAMVVLAGAVLFFYRRHKQPTQSEFSCILPDRESITDLI